MTTINIMEVGTDLQMQQDSKRSFMVFVKTFNDAIYLQDVSFSTVERISIAQKISNFMIRVSGDPEVQAGVCGFWDFEAVVYYFFSTW